MIAKVYLWENNAVTVFNEQGEQILELQGMINEVRDLIINKAEAATKFFLAEWNSGTSKLITKDEFANIKGE